MKWLFCLLLGALPAAGQAPDRPVADIAIYYGFEQPPPWTVLEALEQEAGSILESFSDSIEWRSLAALRSGDTAADLAVVRFKGSCDVSTPMRERFPAGSLGWTHITDGVILPFSDVSCDRIRAFLNDELMRLEPTDRETVFGRAVGRVVAHELYHIFAHTWQHAASGLAKSTFTVRELTADAFRLRDPAVSADAAPRAGFEEGRSLFWAGGCASCHGSRGEGAANGPVLRGRHLNAPTVARKLATRTGVMYRRARNLRIPFRSFSENEAQSLVDFLNGRLR